MPNIFGKPWESTFLLVLALSAVLCPGHAATIVVDTGADPALSTPGVCSLRQAIQASNTHAPAGGCPAGSGADSIVVAVSQIQISQAGADEDNNLTGDLDVASNVSIVGNGAVIDGGSLDRIFDVHSGQLILSDLVLTSGNVVQTAAPNGGAIRVGGPSSKPLLKLLNVEIRLNFASEGGAVYVDDKAGMQAINSTLHGNAAVQIGNNGGGHGGAIFTRGLNATLRNVTLTDNRAERAGGAVFALGFPQIAKNGPSLTMNNVTISANRASNSNHSALGGGIEVHGHPLAFVTNSIVIDNQADQFADCHGSLAALRFNLLPKDFGCDVSGTSDGNVVYDGIGLAPLWNYGGALPTMHPRYLSLARNARAGTDPAQAPCESVDARGFPRPAQGACDFGAVEVQDSFYIDYTGDGDDANPGDGICATTGGQCTLRAAIEELRVRYFNQRTTQTLHIPSGVYNLQLGQLSVDFPLLLIGDGSRDVIVRRADAAPDARVLLIGVPSDSSFVPPASLLEFGVSNGHSFANPILYGDPGGGIFVYHRDTLLYGMDVFGNSAQAGGGLFAWPLDAQTVLVDHSTFRNNFGSIFTLGHGGGAWFHDGNARVVNSTFAYNVSYLGGAGVYVNGAGSASFSNVTIAYNNMPGIGNVFPPPLFHGGAGLRVETGDPVQVAVLNSALGSNHDTDSTTPDCDGNLTTVGYSLIQAGTCTYGPTTGIGVIVGADPLLSPTLGWNGIAPNDRLPQTLPLQPGSPLRDGGAAFGCIPLGLTLTGIPLSKDEAENSRPQGARCDIGAFETSLSY